MEFNHQIIDKQTPGTKNDVCLIADINNDGLVNSKDFAFLVQSWTKTESRQPGDLDRNGIVNTADIALLAEDWLKYAKPPVVNMIKAAE